MNRVLLTGFAGAALAMATGAQAAAISELSAHDMAMQARADQVTANNNGDTRIAVGGTSTNDDFSVPIIQWSLSSVPLGEFATGDGTVTLTIWPFGDNAPANGKIVDVYRIDPANAGWLESQASWAYKDNSSTTAWVGGSGLGSPGGGGYDASPLDSFTYVHGNPTVTFTIPQATLNDWIANPSDNAGVILIMQSLDGTERFMRFYQNNDSAGPNLAFETAIPEPSSVLALVAAGGLMVARRQRRV